MKKVSKIFIINSENNFLMYLRDKDSKIPYPDYWDFIGGEIEKNESKEDAIKREIMEEIGINVNNIRYIGEQYVPQNFLNPLENIVYFFKGEVTERIEYIKLTEGQRLEYFNLNELQKIRLAKPFKDFILKNKQKILKKQQSL